MAYEISPQDFKNIVENPKCSGTETENAGAKTGHSACSHCKGNYFVGGECNYGGRHKMADDLKAINKNFKQFDSLVSQQIKLSKSKNKNEFENSKNTLLTSFSKLKQKCEDESGSGFFYGSCIGLDGTQTQFADRIKHTFQRLARELGYYMDQVQKATWEQLKSFQEKLKKIDKLSSEATKLAEEWKNETDPVKKAQLLVLLNAKRVEVAQAKKDIENDPVYHLFSQEKSFELENIVKNIFQGKAKFFNWKKDEEEEKAEEKSDKYLGVLPKEATKMVLWIGGTIIIGIVAWKIVKSKFK